MGRPADRPQSGPQPAPQAAPQVAAAESIETQEIIRRYRSRKQIYPDIKTIDDLEKKDYNGLTEPLEKNENELPSIESEFLKKAREIEGFMGGANISDFSFGSLKNVPDHKGACENLESRISIVQQSAAGNPPPPPDLEALFKAKDNAEFTSNLNNPYIVNQKFAQDSEFKDRATIVFNTLKNYRDQNAGTIKNQTVRMYLNEIFKASNADELEEIMKKSTIIRVGVIDANPELRAKIRLLHERYKIYKKELKKQIHVEVMMNKEKDTILTSPTEYARSAEKFTVDKIQKLRENWAGMDGKERFIAGATMLVGISWFLNSKNEEVGEVRDILKKVGILGIGYLAVNTSTKLFTGKKASELTRSYLDDRSGKRNFLKSAFDTDKHGAEIMNSALINMGPYDFNEVADSYLKQEAKYNNEYSTVHFNQRELPLGGIAEDQMHPRDIYTAMYLFERKLQKEGSSLEKIMTALNKQEQEAKKQNKPFTRPTFALILSAVLQKDILKHKVDKEGNISVSKTVPHEVPFDDQQKASTRKWWVVTGMPTDWKKQHYDATAFPREEFRNENAKRISSNVIDIKKPISTVIEDQYFGRYTAGFKGLYDLEIKNKPWKTNEAKMLHDTKDNATYIASKVPVDYASFDKNTRAYAQVAGVKSAYDQALKEIETKYGNTPAFKDVKSRIHEFVQPVFGVFLSESDKKSMGPIKEYVMFLRLVLPGNVEFALRQSREWPDGDMIQMMKKEQTPMKLGEKLSRAEFETLAQKDKTILATTKFPKLKLIASFTSVNGLTTSFTSVYGGAYECFLTNMRISKTDTAKIEKALDYYSNLYAGSGMSKVGLVRYLASHKFDDKDIKKALGSNEAIPNEGLDVRNLVDEQTEAAEKEIEAAIAKKQNEYSKIDQTKVSNFSVAAGLSNEIFEMKEKKDAWDTITRNGFDKFFIALCNGDDKALGNSKLRESMLKFPGEFGAIMMVIGSATNPKGKTDAAKEAMFKNGLMPLYKKALLKAAESPEFLKQTMEIVEEYRKPA